MKKGSLVRQELFIQKRNNNNVVYRYGIYLSVRGDMCEVFWHPCEHFLSRRGSYTDWVHSNKLEEVSAPSAKEGGSGKR